MRGINASIVIGDTDGLIATLVNHDVHHIKAVQFLKDCDNDSISLVYPAAIIAESLATITRKLNNVPMAQAIMDMLHTEAIHVVDTTEHIVKKAQELYNPRSSKKDTFFDAIVAATAIELGTKYVFSFDDWYTKQGLQIIKP